MMISRSLSPAIGKIRSIKHGGIFFSLTLQFPYLPQSRLHPSFSILHFPISQLLLILSLFSRLPIVKPPFSHTDVVKTRMQLEKGKGQFGMIGLFRHIVATEGFGRLYRGIIPPLMLEAPKRATKCEWKGAQGKIWSWR